MATMPWPIVVIDFEASSLGEDSYPIEVGIARWREPDAPIEIWSSLIRPMKEWETRHWSAISQTVHGIPREALRDAPEAAAVLGRLNGLCGRQVYCDGGQEDLRWLGGLEHAAGLDGTFLLRDSDELGGYIHPRFYRRMVRWMDRASPRHRAADDAERIVRGLAVGLSLGYGRSVRLD